mmetsp:Transcript_7993/g.24741  ORF Transcript_7993/g.24741 Transcript_7993/m.24741 type:complete len:237 (-) Transcript_7993:195-905(-)
MWCCLHAPSRPRWSDSLEWRGLWRSVSPLRYSRRCSTIACCSKSESPAKRNVEPPTRRISEIERERERERHVCRCVACANEMRIILCHVYINKYSSSTKQRGELLWLLSFLLLPLLLHGLDCHDRRRNLPFDLLKAVHLVEPLHREECKVQIVAHVLGLLLLCIKCSLSACKKRDRSTDVLLDVIEADRRLVRHVFKVVGQKGVGTETSTTRLWVKRPGWKLPPGLWSRARHLRGL